MVARIAGRIVVVIVVVIVAVEGGAVVVPGAAVVAAGSCGSAARLGAALTSGRGSQRSVSA